ncbi:hypothetical protein PFISCL1PPCAC_26296 [Pristionchus fissidentatus]|uniref:Uncharacterized protein n=1 Tax=Pristionchus fissidentatus TaxID=1538716 RepID=A0AAV5WS48_9BILA|nr:hypothetical protein PFISCL1PPCAC_26296 [Pristionchus fissidentatus]
MECPISLTHKGSLLSVDSLIELASSRRLPSITFHGRHNEFTMDYEPATGLDPKGTKSAKSCHFEGVDQSGRLSWLSACSRSNLALIVRTADNVYRLKVTDNGRFVLVPETQPTCDITVGGRSKRQARVAKANPDYYSDFADTLQKRRFVEFAFVADHSVYEKYDKDEEKVMERLQTLANMMNSFYKPINIEIRLVYTEVWTDADKVDVTADSDKTLDAFLQYRKTFLRAHPNDNAHMLTEVRFADGVIGKAFKGTMCSFDYSGGVNVDHQTDAALVASTIAHEMGHNFGMDHDVDYDGTCKCPKNRQGITHCIMAKSAGWEAPSHWSDCSLNYLQTSLGRGVDLCLLNEPDRSEKAVCGNGIVEEREDCDCGVGGCNHDCCDAATCQLTSKAECASGQCCDLKTCKPKARSTQCRSGTNSCDLPEFCDGETPECPADFFVQDGLKCPGDDESHCYNGECGSRRDQCKKIWGDTGRAASDSCYLANTQGNIHGNCGYDAHYDNYTACPDKDKFCGRLHCDKDTEAPIFGNPSSVTVANSNFFNRDKNAYESCYVIKTAYETNNKRKHTPGMTLDGTKCGKNNVCLQTKCVNVAELMKTASKCDNDCNGHGVCNNVGNCHCVNGYGGVACNIPGLGGSVNSNPANMSRGMDVFIITLVVLILCLIGFVALTIDYKRKGKGFLPAIIWKQAKEKLKLRGVLVPTRKAPPPPRSRMKKDSLNEAWGEGGVVTYTANPPPLVAPIPSDSRGFASPAASPDPLITKTHNHVEYHKPALVAPSSISPRPRDPPPSIPSRPRDSVVGQLHSQHGHELGIRSQAPAPPPVKRDTVSALSRGDSITRPGINPPPPPPPHKPKSDAKVPPPLPSKPNQSSSDAPSSSVKDIAARFQKK